MGGSKAPEALQRFFWHPFPSSPEFGFVCNSITGAQKFPGVLGYFFLVYSTSLARSYFELCEELNIYVADKAANVLDIVFLMDYPWKGLKNLKD